MSWDQLVTSFWRRNGAAMVPQSAPPGLHPLVRARMTIGRLAVAGAPDQQGAHEVHVGQRQRRGHGLVHLVVDLLFVL